MKVHERSGVLSAEHEYRPLKWIAAPIALLGVYMVLAGLGWLPADNDPFDLIVGGALIAGFATALATWRQGFRLDLTRRRAVRHTRTLGIVFTRTLPLDEVAGVTLEPRVVRSRATAVTAWFLLLRRRDGGEFELTRFTDESEADHVAAVVRRELDAA
ncbi:MAG: hypothetical protein AB7O97_12455 [Planctomycetota bacterium]